MKITSFTVVIILCLSFNSFESFGQTGWQIVSNVGSTSLKSVVFTDSSNGIAVGGDASNPGFVVRTTDAGVTWVYQPSTASVTLTSVSCANNNICIAVGYRGVILRTTNGGISWTMQDSGATSALWGVSFADNDVAVAVGLRGKIMRTTNSGVSWNPQANPDTNHLEAIQFVNSTIGFAVGQRGAILKTTNAGITWTSLTSGTSVWLSGLSFRSPSTGTTVGGTTILRTTDSGTTWLPQQSGTDTIPFFYGLFGVFFSDSNIGTVVGDCGVILRTTDGGTSWVRQTSGVTIPLFDVFFTNQNVGVVVGQNYILRTSTGGVNGVNDNIHLPADFLLGQNYPNPFNPSTTIRFTVARTSHVLLRISDLLGCEVATLINENKPPGTYHVVWDANLLPSGVYFYSMQFGSASQTKRLMLIK